MTIRSILLISIFKTLYFSARFHGQIIVARGTRIRLDKGARIELVPGARLYLGRGQHIGKPLSLRIFHNGRLSIRGEVAISCGTKVVVGENAHLEIGEKTFINYDSAIVCWKHIAIGEDCAISWNTNIIDGNAHELIVAGKPRPRTRPLIIGDHVLDRDRSHRCGSVGRRRIRGGRRERGHCRRAVQVARHRKPRASQA